MPLTHEHKWRGLSPGKADLFIDGGKVTAIASERPCRTILPSDDPLPVEVIETN